VHPDPDRALSDGYQSLYPEQFNELARECGAIAELLTAQHAQASTHAPSSG